MATYGVLYPQKHVDRKAALDAALHRVLNDDLSNVSLVLLAETLRLWLEINDRAGLVFSNEPNLRPTQRDVPILIGQRLADDTSIDAVITQLTNVNLQDEDDIRRVTISALTHVTPALGNAVAASPSGEVQLLTEAGTLVDPGVDVTLFNSRARLLLGTERALPLVRGMQEQIEASASALAEKVTELKEATADLEAIRSEIAAEREARAHFKLADHYEALAVSEAKQSSIWRWTTIALIALAVVATVLGAREEGWQAVVGHLAVAGAVGGASTYTARLSSVHRSMADWAKGIRVQLNTLDDFLATIDDGAARIRVKEEFSRRVLGAPPTVGGDEVSTMQMAQIIELAAALSRTRAS